VFHLRKPSGIALPGYAALAGLILPYLAVVAAVLLSGVPRYFREGDGALLEYSTRTTAALRTLTGPYSRFGFHHPGPFYFFTRIPMYFLLGMKSSADYVTTSLLAILTLSASAFAVSTGKNRREMTWFCLLAATYMLVFKPVIWLNDWNPFIVVFPMLLAVLSLVAAVSDGRRRWWWAVAGALSGSFAMQTHLGCAPAVVVPALYTLLVLFGRGDGDSKKIAGIFLVVTAASWFPVAVSFFTGAGLKNVYAFAKFLSEGGDTVDPRNALMIWTDAMTGFETFFLPVRRLRVSGTLMLAKGAVLFFRIFLLAYFTLRTGRPRKSGFRFHLGIVVLILHGVTLFSVMGVKGVPHQYLFIWFSVVGLLSWIAIASAVTGEFAWKGRFRDTCSVVAAILTILVGTANAREVLRKGGGLFDPLGFDDPQTREASEDVLAGIPGRGPWVIVPVSHEYWPLMAGLLNALDRDGLEVCVPGGYSFMTGMEPVAGADSLFVAPPGYGSGFLEVLYEDSLVIVGYREYRRSGAP